MRKIPIQTDSDGNARTLRSGYGKFAFTNFTRTLEDKMDGFAATAVMEIYYESDLRSDKNEG